MDDVKFVTCAVCGERIGVYEPLVPLSPAGARRTSLASEPALAAADARLAHEACAAGRAAA